LSQDEMQTVPDGGTLSASDFESLGSQKVQLDIDDAPFLLADEEPGPSSAEQSGALPASQDSPSKPVSRKKKIVIGGVAGLVLLLLAAGLAWFFLSADSPYRSGSPDAPVIVVPSSPPGPELPKELTLRLEPFWVPVLDAEGRQRFLTASFVLGTENGLVYQEALDRLITVRDAIYYYLCNKEYEYLLNADNAEGIKTDLLVTINNYIVQGQIENLYFDSYLLH